MKRFELHFSRTGELAKKEIDAVDEGLALFLGLGQWLRGAGEIP
jgi:hypothetical protein